jgi:hypothetical protein
LKVCDGEIVVELDRFEVAFDLHLSVPMFLRRTPQNLRPSHARRVSHESHHN